MNDYLRSSELVLNTTYPGYSFEIEVFGGCILLWCRHLFSKIDTYFIKYIRIKNADLSHEKIVEEGIRLMNEINKEKFNISYYGMCPGNKYRIAPKELIFQDEKTTIINWTDGTKTIVKCSDDDVFSPEAGVALCYMKKFVTDNDAERFHRLLRGLVSISKFKISKQEDKSSRSKLCEIMKKVYEVTAMEEEHDIDTGTPNNAGDNNSDNPSMEVV